MCRGTTIMFLTGKRPLKGPGDWLGMIWLKYITMIVDSVDREEGILILKTNATLVNKLLNEGRISEEEAEQLLYVIE